MTTQKKPKPQAHRAFPLRIRDGKGACKLSAMDKIEELEILAEQENKSLNELVNDAIEMLIKDRGVKFTD